MSIEILSQAYDETRRLAIAGSGLASGDFRLQKLIAPMAKAGERAPVFAKVATAMKAVVECDSKSASAALLELSTLLTAILYTQGQTAVEGELKPIETSGLSLPIAESSARVLKPLIEALTRPGPGRLEIITSAFERGMFQDLRLVEPAVTAIDDVYGEIGDFVATRILPMYGQAIAPGLRATFDVKGKSAGHLRRLRLLHTLDSEAAGDLIEAALESGSKEMKIVAIECLKSSKGRLSYMIEQTRARAKEVRHAAFRAIARFTDNEVVDSLSKALSGGDAELVATSVSENPSPKLLSHLLELAQRQLDTVLTSTDQAAQKKASARLYHLLSGFTARSDAASQTFIMHCFEQREAILARAEPAKPAFDLRLPKSSRHATTFGSSKSGLRDDTGDGETINYRVATLLARSNSKAAHTALIDAHDTLAPISLGVAMVAAVRTQTPKQVFQVFSPYYLARAEPAKSAFDLLPPKSSRRATIFGSSRSRVESDRTNTAAQQEIVRFRLCHIAAAQLRQNQGIAPDEFDPDELVDAEAMREVTLDPAWLDAAIAAKDFVTVQLLAKPKHQGAIAYLTETLDGLLGQSGDYAHLILEALSTMLRIQHPQAVDSVLKGLEQLGKRRTPPHLYAFWLARLGPDLPKEAIARLEAFLPNLDENAIDAILPHLEQLKAK